MPNRKFGVGRKFGTSTKFGASSGLSGMGFGLEVDWLSTGQTDGFNEATGRLLAWNERRGREFLFESSGGGFQAVSVGEIRFALKNIDGRFDPFNLSGELAPYLYGNQKIRFRVVDYATGTVYSDFVGYIDNIRPLYGTVDTVEITASDGLKKLQDKNISSAEVYSNVQYDDQIVEALRLAGWTDGVDIETTLSDTMTYHWFRGDSAFDEIRSLSDATFGVFFVDEDGQACYVSRVSDDVSVLTLTEADIDYGYGIQAPSPRDVIKNIVRVYARARKLQSAVELWRMTDTPQIASGTGSPIWANYSYNNEEVPALSITTPVENTDYEANDNADGSGTDRSANFSFALTTFAASAKLIPTNSGAAAYITLLKIRGNAITSDKYTFSEEEDETSIASYGERRLTITSDWLQDLNTASDQATILLNRFKNPRFFPRVQIKRSSLTKQYTAGLFDLVTINFASKDISAEMRVGYIERSWSVQSPNVVDTVMYFEPNLTVSGEGVWEFPITFPATLA